MYVFQFFLYSGSGGGNRMNLVLRLILAFVSIITFAYIIRKIRKSQVQIVDMSFWIIFSLILIVISVFPAIAFWGANLLQIATTVNFVFLAVIFLLILQLFSLSIKVSKMDSRIKELVSEIALYKKEEKEKKST